jgi:hypothetical protein
MHSFNDSACKLILFMIHSCKAHGGSNGGIGGKVGREGGKEGGREGMRDGWMKEYC